METADMWNMMMLAETNKRNEQRLQTDPVGNKPNEWKAGTMKPAKTIFSVSSKTHYRKEIAAMTIMQDLIEQNIRHWFSVRHEYPQAYSEFRKGLRERKYWQNKLFRAAKKYSALFE